MTDSPNEKKIQIKESTEELDFQEIFRLILKYDKFLAGIVAACMAIALAYCLFVPKTWEAEVSIKLPTQDDNSLLQQLVMSANNNDPVETYQEIAQSTNVVSRAAVAVGLTATAEYVDEDSLNAVVEKLKKKMKVSRIKDSNIITVQVDAKDKNLVVRLADALAQAFIDANLDFSRVGARSRRQAIEEQIGQVKTQLVQDELKLEKASLKMKSLVSAENNMQGGDDQNSQSTSQSNAAVDPLVKLKEDIIDMKVERAELSSRFSDAHPSIQDIDAKIKFAEDQYNREMNKLPADTMNFNRLVRDLKVDEGVYVLLLEKLQEERVNENADDTDIVVVDFAQPPIRPVAPRAVLILFLTLFGSAFLGFNLFWAWDHFKLEVDGEESLVKRSGLPLLALIPNWRLGNRQKLNTLKKNEKLKERHHFSYLFDQTDFENTYYAESFKILRTNLTFAGLGPQKKTVAILSSNPEEGKTLCNANLAIALAQSGKRVLLCDADLRKPEVHKIFGIDADKNQGLPLLLSGQGLLEKMVVSARQENLWLLPCGVLAPNPAELLGSERLQVVVEEMKKQYDYVVFDAAPVLPVTDSLMLAIKLDGIVLAARYGSGRLLEVERTIQRLRGGKVHLYGCILNAVDVRRYSFIYGYGKTYSGYGENKS